MQFLQLRPIAILAAFILIYLINAQGEDIDRDFHVASGEEPGSCDKTKRDFAPKGLDLNSFYREAFEMAGYTANRMIEYGSDQVVRATLLTFFGIREDPTTNPVSVMRADIGLYEAIADTFAEIWLFPSAQAGRKGATPLFCDTTWLQLTSTYYDKTTGLPTGQTISEISEGRFTQMYYSPLFKDYLGGTRIPCDSNVLAFTGPPHLRSITLCPLMFSNTNSQSKSMLEPYRAPNGLPPNQPLQEYMSWSGTFLHEMTHLLRPGIIIDQPIEVTAGGEKVQTHAYGVNRCVRLARLSPELDVQNADSYRWFATAMYLDQWDWSRSYGLLPVQVPIP